MLYKNVEDWYKTHKCHHAHCPKHCEHPQPYLRNNVLICGKCAVLDCELVEMMPCNPEICDDADGS